MGKTKAYSNGEVTAVWEAEKCIHSAICVKELPNIFNPEARPWIKIDAASTKDLVNTVKKCPSGALGFYMDYSADQTSKPLETKVEVLENRPLLVYGTLKVTDKHGNSETKNKITAFCRCGVSQNKPYCDGVHVKAGFRG
tara:strand:+ start:120 stop:539 length:420 start_codon:yes stop_codon:yes gene_type:complete